MWNIWHSQLGSFFSPFPTLNFWKGTSLALPIQRGEQWGNQIFPSHATFLDRIRHQVIKVPKQTTTKIFYFFFKSTARRHLSSLFFPLNDKAFMQQLQKSFLLCSPPEQHLPPSFHKLHVFTMRGAVGHRKQTAKRTGSSQTTTVPLSSWIIAPSLIITPLWLVISAWLYFDGVVMFMWSVPASQIWQS